MNPVYPLSQRDTIVQRMCDGELNHWDLIVIGGGITGAGVLREAARQGYKVLLLEQKDFAWGTSSRSSKMIHGGLRYLAAGDVKLTRESLSERERLLKEMPGLIERMGYYFTLNRSGWLMRWGMSALLGIYDRIAGIRDHRYLNRDQLQDTFSGRLNPKTTGACYYTDAVTDDARLVMRVIQEGIDSAGCALNYIRVVELQQGLNGVSGVLVESAAGQRFSLNAPVVINATGVWADRLRNSFNPERRIRPLRGSHLVLPRAKLPIDDVVAARHPHDKRAVFVFPWEGATVVGTTDLDHPSELDTEASISAEEVDYLLALVDDQFPDAGVNKSDILSTYAGVRPVIGSEKNKDPSSERRDHAVWFDKGLVTVSGGKLTTFRLIALDALAAASARLKSASAPAQPKTEETPPADPLIQGRYGAQAQCYREQALAEELTFIGTTRFSLADCRWSLRHESVCHLDDLLLRRTRLGLLLDAGGQALFDALKGLCREELGWDESRWNEELARYQALWRQHYFLPDEEVS